MKHKTIREEAAMMQRMTGGDLMQLHNLLNCQFSVMQSRAQVLVSIAGIVVTVTGFSGRIIAGTHLIGQVLVIAGLFIVIISAIYVIARVLRIRWLTAMMEPDSLDNLAEILKIRDNKLGAFHHGSIILFVGLVCYALAISVMLLNPTK